MLRQQDARLLKRVVVRKSVLLDCVEDRDKFRLGCVVDYFFIVERLVLVLTKFVEVDL